MTRRPRPLVLCILDGWGERDDGADNAIERASTPVWHALTRRWPHSEARRQRALCRAARRADGQFRGRAHQSRRRPGRLCRICRASTGRSPTDRWRALPAVREFIAKAEGARRRGACHRAAVAGRRAFAPGSDLGLGCHSRRGRGCGRGACAARRARHAAEMAVGYLKKFQARHRRARRYPDRDNRRALLRHGPRQALGPRCEGIPRY